MRSFLLYCLFYFVFQSTLLLGQSQNTPTVEAKVDYFDRAYDLFFENLDSSLFYFQQGLPYYKARGEWTKYVNCHNALTSGFVFKGDFTKSNFHALQAFNSAEKYLSGEDLAYGNALNNLASNAHEKGDYEKAIDWYQKALKIEEEHGKLAEEIVILNNLGNCFSKKGDYFESKRYYKRVLRSAVSKEDSNYPNFVNSYMELANIHRQIGEVDTALSLYEKGLSLINQYATKEVTISARRQRRIHLERAEIFLEEGLNDRLQEEIDLAIYYSKLAFGREAEEAYVILGKWALREKKYGKAIFHFRKALQLSKAHYQVFKRHPRIGDSYFYLAQVYFEKGAIPQSLVYFQNALEQYSENDSSGIEQAAQAEDLISDPIVLKILKEKGDAEFENYLQGGKEEDLLTARATYLLAIQMLKRLRQSYLGKRSKEILVENVIPVFEGALKVNFTLYQLRPEPKLYNEIFQIAENSKAILLLESINETTASAAANIPDSLLQKEKTLKLDIAYHEKQKVLLQNNQIEKKKNIEEGLFDLEKKHRELIQIFETEFPDYHQLKYNTTIATLEEVRKKMTEKSALLEYFVGENSIFLFCITTEKILLRHLARPAEFTQQVEELRKLLLHPPGAKNAQKDFDAFCTTASSLYQQLIAPANLDSTIEQILLIPDDILAYLPFEIFLQNKEVISRLDYSSEVLEYLVNDYQISYNYSATLLTHFQNNLEKAPRDFIGFAPDFGKEKIVGTSFRDCKNEQLSNLACNKKEVREISKILNGETLIGASASKAKFAAIISDYRIAHFATHSCLDDENPMLNKIFLSDDYISTYDLYNLRLKTELTVLSACNTGSGKLSRGEGVISLSRGFMHAGCPSVLMSLWAVEDCTTSAIMNQYYQGIEAGKTKDRALKESKLHYLQNANKLERHPFFWAAFVQFGEVVPISSRSESSDFNFWKWFWCLLPIIGIASYLFYKKNKD